MLNDLKAYSAMVREKREELDMSLGELALKSKVSSKTLDIIVNEKWPKRRRLSPPQQRAQGLVLTKLAPVLGFDPDLWRMRLELPHIRNSRATVKILSREDLEYLLKIVEISGSLTLNTALDLLDQRSTKEGAAE